MYPSEAEAANEQRIDELLPRNWLALTAAKSGGVIMAVIAHVFSISYVANLLGENEYWLFEPSTDLFPEDRLPL